LVIGVGVLVGGGGCEWYEINRNELLSYLLFPYIWVKMSLNFKHGNFIMTFLRMTILIMTILNMIILETPWIAGLSLLDIK
jgi:hypothetical protein